MPKPRPRTTSESSYQIDLGDWKRVIEQAPGRLKPLIKRSIAALSLDQRPPYAQELRKPNDTPSGIFRIRVERWRIVYTVDDEIELVTILKVGEKRGAEFYEGVFEP